MPNATSRETPPDRATITPPPARRGARHPRSVRSTRRSRTASTRSSARSGRHRRRTSRRRRAEPARRTKPRYGSVAMTEHAVVIAGGGPAGMMLAAELALAKVDVAVVERRRDHVLADARAGGIHSRTIEVLDQRGVADRFLA